MDLCAHWTLSTWDRLLWFESLKRFHLVPRGQTASNVVVPNWRKNVCFNETRSLTDSLALEGCFVRSRPRLFAGSYEVCTHDTTGAGLVACMDHLTTKIRERPHRKYLGCTKTKMEPCTLHIVCMTTSKVVWLVSHLLQRRSCTYLPWLELHRPVNVCERDCAAVWPDGYINWSIYGRLQQWKFAQKFTKIAKVVSIFWQILNKPQNWPNFFNFCPKWRNFAKSDRTGA